MVYRHCDLRDLAARGSTLRERLACGAVRPSHDHQPPHPAAQRRIARWVTVTAGTDVARFDRRLRWAEWDRDAALVVLGPVAWDDSAPLPAWVHTLAGLVAPAPADARALPVEPDARAVPFAHVFAPLAAGVRERLASVLDSAPERLAPSLLDAAERRLVREMATLCAPTLMLAWSAVRAADQELAWSATPDATAPNAAAPLIDRAYARFTRRLRDGGLAALLLDYPVLARLLATTAEHWSAATGALCARLIDDHALLGRVFAASGPPLGAAVDAEFGLSDPHRGGETVCIARFASGRAVVYKPRGLGIEQRFYTLLRWLTAQGAALPLRALTVVDRGTYGWAEYAEPAPCRTRAEAARYAERMGALLAVHHALGGSDLHFENVVACGEHPVVIDAEALLQPALCTPEAGSGDGPPPVRTVLQTGMLGQWRVGDDGALYDLSGITGRPGAAAPVRRAVWDAVNTDRMASRTVLGAQPGPARVNDGPDVGAPDLVANVKRGFARMYDLLLARRADLLAPGGPVHDMAGGRVRFLLRHTAAYGAVHRRALHPRYLSDGADRSIELDALSRTYLSEPEPGGTWPLLDEELAALEQMDVPVFESGTESATLHAPQGRSVAGVSLTPALGMARTQLAALGQGDRAFQLALVHIAMRKRSLPCAPDDAQALAGDTHCDDTLAGLARDEARRIAAQIVGATVRAGGRRAFVSYSATPRLNGGRAAAPYTLRFMGQDLYDGRSGVALFLAALARLCPGEGYEEAAFATACAVRARVAGGTAARAYAAHHGAGAGMGLGGVAYGLARVGALLDDPGLMRAAVRTARELCVPAVGRGAPLDMMHGVAGTALALLAVHKASGATEPLARAAEFGRHLLAADAARYGVVQAPGFAHGRAGIHYALLSLYRATGFAPFHAAVAVALAEGDSECAVDPAAARTDAHAPLHCTWCHDATGAALARATTLDVLDSPALRATLTVALEATRRAGIAPLDHVCCGTLGRASALAEGGAALGHNDLTAAGTALVRATLRRARARGQYTCFPGVDDRFCLGFFQGISGIGFELLRLTHPGRLPAVALWE